MKTFKVSENMIMWSFRYSLGRKTGAVTDVVEHLKKHWKDLKPFIKHQIKEEIKTAISKDLAGDNCDIKNWKEILDLKESGE